MGKIKDDRIIIALLQAFNDPDKTIRTAIQELIIITKWNNIEKFGESIVPHLVYALQVKNNDVRYKAALALGEIKAADAVEPLLKALKSRDTPVKRRVIWALGEIGNPKAIKPLQKAEKNKNWVIKRAETKAIIMTSKTE